MIKKNKKDIGNNLTENRTYKVVKANELIQKSRFNLKAQEQKIILYLISKIKPEDMQLKEHTFKIQDFCEVCGFDGDNGENYRYIKQTLQDLRDKSIWILLDDGSQTTLSWLDYVTMYEHSGTVIIKISDMMKPYLLQLQKNFTQYELLYTLAMKSRYSIHLYEILKSYEFQKKQILDIDELKIRMSAENYTRFPDFQRYVLDTAMREINDLSDINVEYDIIKDSRRFAEIEFYIKTKKDLDDRLKTWAKIYEIIGPK